jgi:hypothetical protein
MWFKQNIKKGITSGLYRAELDVNTKFYYTLIFNINENSSEKIAQQLELEALEYHTRAMATLTGITELENQLQPTI